MTGNEVAESGFRARAGALTLMYIASPMERSVLLTILAEVNTGVTLQEIEPPDPEFLRMGIFEDSYLLEPADPDHPPGTPINEDTLLQPTPAGRELPFVGAVLEAWLNACPAGLRSLGPEAGPVLGPLLWGWSSMLVHVLAAGPLTAAEMCAAVQVLELELVEARLDLMEEAGLVRESPGSDGEPRFEATEWLRMGIAPLAAAARMEHRHPPGDTAAISALDVEAAFRLTLPLLELPQELSGTCSLTIDLDESVPDNQAGVTARVEAGRVVSCEAGPDEGADAWATAPVADWLDTVIEPDAKRVRTGGDKRLPSALLRGLHKTLFGMPTA